MAIFMAPLCKIVLYCLTIQQAYQVGKAQKRILLTSPGSKGKALGVSTSTKQGTQDNYCCGSSGTSSITDHTSKCLELATFLHIVYLQHFVKIWSILEFLLFDFEFLGFQVDKFLSEFEVCHEILHDMQRDHELDSEYCRSDYIYAIATDCCTECTSKQKGNKISAVFRGLIRPARGTCHLVLLY